MAFALAEGQMTIEMEIKIEITIELDGYSARFWVHDELAVLPPPLLLPPQSSSISTSMSIELNVNVDVNRARRLLGDGMGRG